MDELHQVLWRRPMHALGNALYGRRRPEQVLDRRWVPEGQYAALRFSPRICGAQVDLIHRRKLHSDIDLGEVALDLLAEVLIVQAGNGSVAIGEFKLEAIRVPSSLSQVPSV